MLGLGYLIFFGIYFYIVFVATRGAVRFSRKHNRSSSLWGGFIALLFLCFVFWDLIPVYGVHHHYCSQEGGFTIYKTIDEWKKENPSIAETLVETPIEGQPTKEGSITRYQLNQRLAWEITQEKVWHIVYRRKDELVDLNTLQVLARNIDFHTNYVNPLVRPTTDLNNFKIWLHIPRCAIDYENNKWVVRGDSFGTFQSKFNALQGGIK